VLSTLLVQASWIPATVLLLAVLTGPFVGAAIAPRRRLLRALFIVSLVIVAGLTLYPEGGPGTDVTCAVEVPYFGVRAVETLANVLLFIPPVLLAGLLARRPLLAIIGGSATSALIELVQAFVPAIGRACDTGDWITNTIGSVLGGAIALAALALEGRRRAAP
jgi:hypothetical protein